MAKSSTPLTTLLVSYYNSHSTRKVSNMNELKSLCGMDVLASKLTSLYNRREALSFIDEKLVDNWCKVSVDSSYSVPQPKDVSSYLDAEYAMRVLAETGSLPLSDRELKAIELQFKMGITPKMEFTSTIEAPFGYLTFVCRIKGLPNKYYAIDIDAEGIKEADGIDLGGRRYLRCFFRGTDGLVYGADGIIISRAVCSSFGIRYLMDFPEQLVDSLS